jgi:glycosyltransferase involved in cell wall biosynthesis
MTSDNSATPRKTTLLIGYFPDEQAGAPRQVCQDLQARLPERGWRVIAASRRKNRLLRGFEILSTIASQRKIYHVAHVDVFSGPAFAWAELSAALLRSLRKPFVLTLHGGNLPRFASRFPNRVRRVLRSATRVTAPSRYLQDSLRRFRGDIEIIPNGLDIVRYPYRSRRVLQPRLIWLRAFHKIYRPEIAIEVLEILISKGLQPQLEMVGPDRGDGSFAEVKARSMAPALKGRIKLLKGIPKSRVPLHLSDNDVFLNTTSVDNTPVTVLEAMACGLCVLATRVGGLSYLVEHANNGLLSSADNPGEMADQAALLLRDPELAARISRGARATAEQRDWEAIMPRWDNLFSTLASAAPR